MPDEVAGLRWVSGVPQRGADGRDFLELSLPPGRHYLIALTAGGRTVVVGDSAEIGLAEPVRDLLAFRMHDVVRLSWIWPDDATDAKVRWPGGEHRCSRRVYDDEGGVTLSVGQAETLIEVRAVYSLSGRRADRAGCADECARTGRHAELPDPPHKPPASAAAGSGNCDRAADQTASSRGGTGHWSICP